MVNMAIPSVNGFSRNIWRWLFVFALLVYLLAATFQLRLPGLYYDEALDAVPAMQMLLGQPLETQATVHIAGHEWPLMLMSYVGSTTTYLSMIVFALFGPSVVALRLMNALLGLVVTAAHVGLFARIPGRTGRCPQHPLTSRKPQFHLLDAHGCCRLTAHAALGHWSAVVSLSMVSAER